MAQLLETLGVPRHDYPWARTTQERMVCIDKLIRAFHIGLQTGKLNCSVANHLIEGSHNRVLKLLDGLSARPIRVDNEQRRTISTASTPGAAGRNKGAKPNSFTEHPHGWYYRATGS
jgi:hypothetical protein